MNLEEYVNHVKAQRAKLNSGESHVGPGWDAAMENHRRYEEDQAARKKAEEDHKQKVNDFAEHCTMEEYAAARKSGEI